MGNSFYTGLLEILEIMEAYKTYSDIIYKAPEQLSEDEKVLLARCSEVFEKYKFGIGKNIPEIECEEDISEKEIPETQPID